MWQSAPRLPLSPSEQAILEAVAASDEILDSVRLRARIVLSAAQGVPNHRIAQELEISRARVLQWRSRFLAGGIRGLWDKPRVPPREPIPESVEQAVLFDSLYRPRIGGQWLKDGDPSSRWNVRNLARTHKVSRASVQRIWKKHGIVMTRDRHVDLGVDLQQLKISQDPLFGLTLYEIAGLFYETNGPAVAFCSRECPFSEYRFSPVMGTRKELVVGSLVKTLKSLDKRWFGPVAPAADRFIPFVTSIRSQPRHAGAVIHLVMNQPGIGAPPRTEIQERWAKQQGIHIHNAPWPRRCTELAERWLSEVSSWPMQASFVESLNRMRQLLRTLPPGKYLDTLAIW